MKFAECCNTTTSYIGHIETGRKFPSMELIEKMAETLKIEPYHFFINRIKQGDNIDTEKVYPKLPKSMKNEIKDQMDLSISEVINGILSRY